MKLIDVINVEISLVFKVNKFWQTHVLISRLEIAIKEYSHLTVPHCTAPWSPVSPCSQHTRILSGL